MWESHSCVWDSLDFGCVSPWTHHCLFLDGSLLTRLLNLCISNMVFPSAWKVAKVTPVYKGNGSRSDRNNYRPISVLPVLFMLLKRHICDHLCDFLTSNKYCTNSNLGLESCSPLRQLCYDLLMSFYSIWTRTMLLAW